MKKIFFLFSASVFCTSAFAQQSNTGGALANNGIFKLQRPGVPAIYFIYPYLKSVWYVSSPDCGIYYGTIFPPPGGNCPNGKTKIDQDYEYRLANQYLQNNSYGATVDVLATTSFSTINNFWNTNQIIVGFGSGSQLVNSTNMLTFTPTTTGTITYTNFLGELTVSAGGFEVQKFFTIPLNTNIQVEVTANYKNGQTINGVLSMTTGANFTFAVADIRGQIKDASLANYHIKIYMQ